MPKSTRPGYYEKMYRPHWFLRNRRKYEERDAALLRIVRPTPGRASSRSGPRAATRRSSSPRASIPSSASTRRPSPSTPRGRSRRRAASRTSGSRRPTPAISHAFREDRSTSSSSPTSSSTSSTTSSSRVSRARAGVLAPGGAVAIYTPNADHWAERIKAAVPGLQQEDHIAVRPADRVVVSRRGGWFPRRRPLLLREPVSRSRRPRPGVPDGRPLPFPDVSPGSNVLF